MITIEAYFMGRDESYASCLTADIQKSAAETVRRTNLLLQAFYAANPKAHERGVNSGWRPPAINACVPGAAKLSNHMTGKAVDLGDDDGQLDAFCVSPAGQKAMTDIGLWMESPSATPRWCHVQIVPPGSGRRIFNP